MELKVVTKTTKYVDSFDLTEYLGSKIGRSVEFVDTRNDTDYSLSLTKEEILNYDKRYIDHFLNVGWISLDHGYHAVLTYCVNKGWLDEGDYVIQVSW
jgi:hypothetical protein